MSPKIQLTPAATAERCESRPLDLTGKWLAPTAQAAFSADGRQAAAVSREDARIVSVVDTKSGATLRGLEQAAKDLQLKQK